MLEISKELIGGKMEEVEEMITMECKISRQKWRVVRVYVSRNMQEKLERMRESMKEMQEGKKIIRDDFNARIGKREGMMKEEGKEGKGGIRNRKKWNKEEKILVNKLKEVGWAILNASGGR